VIVEGERSRRLRPSDAPDEGRAAARKRLARMYTLSCLACIGPGTGHVGLVAQCKREEGARPTDGGAV
jgi:hypothetical protein